MNEKLTQQLVDLLNEKVYRKRLTNSDLLAAQFTNASKIRRSALAMPNCKARCWKPPSLNCRSFAVKLSKRCAV